jgi:hypothetical protein
MVKERVVPPEMDGGPKPDGLVLSRVSTTRHGGIETKRNPEVGSDTVILPLVPVIVDDNRSLAVSETTPGVTSEAENVPTPLVSFASPGNVAKGSVLVKCTGSV